MAKNLRMIDGEPEIRRDYFHELMFHVKPATKKLYNDYQRALKQRNKCLKQKLAKSELSIWSQKLAQLGLELSLEQYSFCLLYTSPSPRDATLSRMPSSA